MNDERRDDHDGLDAIEPSLAHAAVQRDVPQGATTKVLADCRRVVGAGVHFAQKPASSAALDSGDVRDVQPGSDPGRPRSLAATATRVYADACELVAIALMDIAEYDMAVGSLTQVLPTATAAYTRGGRDGWTQEIAQPVDARTAAAPEEKKPRRRIPRLAIALGIAVLAIGAAAGAFFYFDGPGYIASMTAEVDDAAVTAVLEGNAEFMAGFAASDYVAASPYALSDVRIERAERAEDGSVTVEATAKLANESFSSDCAVTLSFVHSSQLDRFPSFEGVEHAESPDGEWTGALLSSTATTRAIAGVTVDPEFGDAFAPAFDEATQTCTFTSSSTSSLWFGSWSSATPYTYTFDGTAWSRAEGETSSSFAYDADAIAGSYAAVSGDASRMTSFKIVGFDAQQGTFTLEYKASSTGFSPQAISGVLTCTMSSSPASEGSGDFSQSDGYVYTFVGDGTSSAGDGTSHIEGVLGLDGEIFFDFSGDYTKPAFLFGNPSNETMAISGSVDKTA